MNLWLSGFRVCSLRESASPKGISLGTTRLVEEGINFGHGRELIMVEQELILGMVTGRTNRNFSSDCVADHAQSENRDHAEIVLGCGCSLHPRRSEASEDAAPLLRPRTLLRFDSSRYGERLIG
jgi:hypothetical protein